MKKKTCQAMLVTHLWPNKETFPMKLYTLAIFAFGALAACSSQHERAEDLTGNTTQASSEVGHVNTTIKPGPDVTISTQLREPVSPGNTGALEIVFKENYTSGRMKVKASTSEGIRLITTIDEAEFDMASDSEHNWTVFFDTEDAGRHYVNLWVGVETPFGQLTRQSAAVIKVGTGDFAPKNKQFETEAGPDGKPVIRMEAQETISGN